MDIQAATLVIWSIQDFLHLFVDDFESSKRSIEIFVYLFHEVFYLVEG